MSQSKGDILKVRLGNDLRRLVLYNTHISYDDLVLMLQRVYGGKLKSSDEVTLKYYDDGRELDHTPLRPIMSFIVVCSVVCLIDWQWQCNLAYMVVIVGFV